MPTNDDFESILKKNLNHTKPLEMKQKEVNGTKSLFPFWTPVDNGGADVFYDPEEYLSKKDKAMRDLKDNTGIVEPTSEFKTTKNGTIEVTDSYEDYTIVGKMQKLIDKMNGNGLDDKTGVVTVTTENMPKKTTKIQSEFDNDIKEVKTKSHAASPKGDKVGIVKPKTEDMPTKKTTQQTKQDGKVNPVETKSHAASPKGDKVGVVKLKTEDMLTKKATPKTSNDKIESKVDVDSNAAKPKGDNVGIVKPKSDVNVAPSGINFDKYM